VRGCRRVGKTCWMDGLAVIGSGGGKGRDGGGTLICDFAHPLNTNHETRSNAYQEANKCG
jgi:hypothetical protein